MRRWTSESFYRLVDFIPKGLKYRLAYTPLIGVYRSISRVLGAPIEDGYHVVASGPLQGKQLYTGAENVRGYPSIREYMQGTYEPMVVNAIVQNCKPGATVLDIGAHYGYFSLLMAQVVGNGGQCIAFEANLSNSEKILRTKEINRIDNLSVEHLAISNQPGMVEFLDHVNSLMGHMVEKVEDFTSVGETELVSATTIDLYVEQKQITNLSFIKIDIEGAERKAIEGGSNTIQKYKPALLVEVHTFIPPGELARPLIYSLARLGYQAHYLLNGEKVDPLTFTGGHILAKPEV